MQLTDTQRAAAREFIKKLRSNNPGERVDLMLEAAIIGYRQDNNLDMAQAVEVVRQVYYEDEARRQSAYRRNGQVKNPSEAAHPHMFSLKMFLGLVMMVLFVVFCAGYEGARRAFLARDVEKVVEIDSKAEKVESQLDSYAENRDRALETWRQSAKYGRVTAQRDLGLLALTGRGGVEDPCSEPVMLRTWNVFAFAFYFGMVCVLYYLIRPLFLMSRKKRGCISSLFFMLACLVSTYLPGMVVFHYARQWYPAFSAWMTRMIGLILQ